MGMRVRTVAPRVAGFVIVVALVIAAVLVTVYGPTGIPGLAPRPATGLQDLRDLSQLQMRFNEDVGKPRLILLISPT